MPPPSYLIMSEHRRRSTRRATAPTSPSSTPSTPPTIDRDPSVLQMEQAMSSASLGSKRQPDEQTTCFSTPTREHASLKQKTSKATSTPIISDIKVHLIGNTTSKDGEVWYKGTFSVVLFNKKRCKVSSTKEDWLGQQFNGVMEKLRKLIADTVKLSDLDHSFFCLDRV